MHLGRRFARGEMFLRFGRAVGRTSGLSGTSGVEPRPAGPRASRLSRIARGLRELGPHAAIALILPGGSLIALAMWTFRHRSWLIPAPRRMLVLAAAVGASLILPGNL